MAKSNRAKLARDYYIKKGYEPHQAAAIVGNFVQESGPDLSTTAEGDNGTAFGIAQWRGDRLRNLKNYAKEQGADWTDFQTQLGFADWELKNVETGAYEALTSAKDITSATEAMIGYERPQGWTPDNPRGGHAWTSRLENAMGLMGGTYSEEEGASPASGYSSGSRLSQILADVNRPSPAGMRLAGMNFKEMFATPPPRPMNLPDLQMPPMPTAGGGGAGGGGWGGPPESSGTILPFSKYSDGIKFDPQAGLLAPVANWLDRINSTALGAPVTEEAWGEAMEISTLIGGLGFLAGKAPANALFSGAARKPLGEIKFMRRSGQSDKWDVSDSRGVIDVEIVDIGDTLYIAWIGPKGKTMPQAYREAQGGIVDYLGPSAIRELLVAIRDKFPKAQKIAGYRTSGSRAQHNKEGLVYQQLPGVPRPPSAIGEQLLRRPRA